MRRLGLLIAGDGGRDGCVQGLLRCRVWAELMAVRILLDAVSAVCDMGAMCFLAGDSYAPVVTGGCSPGFCFVCDPFDKTGKLGNDAASGEGCSA